MSTYISLSCYKNTTERLYTLTRGTKNLSLPDTHCLKIFNENPASFELSLC